MCNPHAHAHAYADGYRNTYRNPPRNAYAYAYPRTKWEISSDTETTSNSSAASDALALFRIEAENSATRASQFSSLVVNGQSAKLAFFAP